MYKEFQFPYGESYIKASIPERNIAMVLTRGHEEGLANETEAIIAALRNPTGQKPLNECVSRESKVVLIVTDNTRACPDDRLLPPILRELERKVPRENITIIIALGLHTPLSESEMIKKLGREIVSNYRVVNHDPDQVVSLGKTSRGTPIEVNRQVVEADFRISTGFIEPHFFAGFSGGRKSIAPGVSGRRAICHNHGFDMIEHPLSQAGILKGNPIHEDMVEQARAAGLNFIVNVLLNGDKQITHVFAGDPVEAHEQGCEMERRLAGVKVHEKADITITSNTGAPLDLDLYQACKGIDNAARITREGGVIIMVSACNKGVGSEAFRQMHMGVCSAEEALCKIREEGHAGGHWQNQILARAQLSREVYLVSDLDDETVSKMLMAPVGSIEEGLEKAFQKLGREARTAIMPQGSLVLPLVEE